MNNGDVETLTVICTEDEDDVLPGFVLYLFPVSIFFLVLTVGIYLKTKSYKTDQDISTIIICLCLSTVLVIRVFYLLNLNSNILYILDEYVGKFALIAYFSWLNILMAYILCKLM